MTMPPVARQRLRPCGHCGHIRNFHTVMPGTSRDDEVPGKCCVVTSVTDHLVVWCDCARFKKS